MTDRLTKRIVWSDKDCSWHQTSEDVGLVPT